MTNYHVEHNVDGCSDEKPWAVMTDDSGDIIACHLSEQEARDAMHSLLAGDERSINLDAMREVRTAEFTDAELKGNTFVGRVRYCRRLNLDAMREVRTAEFTDAELKGNTFVGLAAAYDTVADLGQFTESIQRGAFRKVLALGDNVPMLWDHNDFWPPFATTSGGTLELRDDPRGLVVKADLDPNHILNATLRGQIEKGNVRGMSFGFVAGKGNSRLDTTRNKPHRDLLGFNRLLDVSPTWNPAYQGTEAAFRSLDGSMGQTFADIERVQQALLGEHQQGESRAALDGADANEAEESAENGEQSPNDASGVAVRAAARKRLLKVQALRLPKEFRG